MPYVISDSSAISNPIPGSLANILGKLPKIALAFSGGVDSRFLAFVAKMAGCRITLWHAKGPHIPRRESDYAKDWAEEHGFEFYGFWYNPLQMPQVTRNSQQRCYACKKLLLNCLKQELFAKLGTEWCLCDGSQMDDDAGFRPGRMALLEAQVRSPLKEAGMNKAAIRYEGKRLGLDKWDQKARPCLLTRLAYGLTPNSELLTKIDACEWELEKYFMHKNLEEIDFRLRITPTPLLQCSNSLGELLPDVKALLTKHGFNNAGIRENDKISGFFDSK